MANKLDYLKRCVTTLSQIDTMNWYTLAFSIPVLKETQNWQSLPPLALVTRTDGLYHVDTDNEQPILVRIDDHRKDEPLFSFQDAVEVDSSWLPTISGKVTTKIGILLFNAVVLYPSVGEKVDYINTKIKVSDIEALLATRVRNDDVATDKDILVSEMVHCIDRLTFLSNLATLINIAATPKVITRPPGIDEVKKKLFAEYQDQLSDPVKVVELENKLQAIDDEYLKDDPAATNIVNKKSRTARKKMYLTYGEVKDFVKTSENNVILPSLTDGVSTSDEDFPKYMNDLRVGSYSRGASTALSGYTYKILQRSIAGISISPTPCTTTRGLTREITQSNYKKLAGRYIKDKGWKLVDGTSAAKTYIGQQVETRSALFCTTPGNMVCFACMSENYKNTPAGTTNLASDLSSAMMTMFLKIMHQSGSEVTDVQIKDLCT